MYSPAPPQHPGSVSSPAPPPQQTNLWNQLFALSVLILGLLLSVSAAWHMKSMIDRDAEHDFSVHSGEVQHKIKGRLDAYARLLQGGVSFFNASDEVSREAWHTFIQDQQIDKLLPGILGVGFNLLIPRDQLELHTQSLHKEGFADYQIHPAGEREVYTSIIYLEPFTGRNQVALGYDTFSEPARRAAMERARDTGQAALTGKVKLIQETDQDVQSGVLMYAPVYRKGLPVQTVEERRRAIYGWISGPCRMNDLMHGIFGIHNLETDNSLHLQIFDGDQLLAQNLLYNDSSPSANHDSLAGVRFTRQATVDFNGHNWTLVFKQSNRQSSVLEYLQAWLILAGGSMISLLMFALIRNLQRAALKTQQTVTTRTAELLTERQRLNSLVDNSPMAAVEWDSDFIVTRWAGEAENIFGWSPEETLGKPIMDLHMIFEEDIPLVQQTMEQLVDGHSKYVVSSNRNYTKDGRVIYCEWYNSILFDDQGQMLAVLSQVLDITKRKLAENEHDKLIAQLQGKSDEMERFVYTVSHDLKSPLVTITGFLNFLERDFQSGNEAGFKTNLTTIANAANRMQRLLAELLELARVGMKKNSVEVVNLGALIKQAVENVSGLLGQAMATVEVEEGLPEVRVDTHGLLQIFENLLSNAAKFSDPAKADHTIRIGVRHEHETLLCFVEDNGVGMLADHFDRVFGVFEKLDQKSEGTGVGLAIVKRLVEGYSGKIWVESAGPGCGCTFSFTLPGAKV